MKKITVFVCFYLGITALLFPQERFRRTPPNPEPLPALNLPEAEIHILANKLKVSVVQRENLPMISLRLVILSGESSSPDSYPGMATFAANMLSKETLNYSAEDIEEIIDSVGGEFTTTIYPDYTVFSFSFLEEHIDEALALISEMILRPTFSRREIDNVKRSMYYDLANRRLDPEFAGKKLLYKLMFQDHAYQKMVFNEDVIKNFNQKALREFFNLYYRPNNAIMVLVGNLNLETATRKVSHHLNMWRPADLEYRPLPFPKIYEQQKVCFLEIPRQRDATIYMGVSIPPISEIEYFPLLVWNQVLGGTQISRLFMNLRETKGFAYWADSHLEFFETCGVFYIRARVRSEVTTAAVREVYNEINRITTRRIPSQEIELAKSYLLGNFPLKINSHENLSSWISQIQVFGLGQALWSEYYENIILVNTESVFSAVQNSSLLTPLVVIVGDSSVLVHLEDFEEVEVYNNKGEYQYSYKGEIR